MRTPSMKKAILAAAILASSAAHAAEPAYSEAMQACSSSESWSYGAAIPEDWKDDYKAYLGRMLQKIPPVRGFAQGLALRRFAKSSEAKAFGEYWISRSLLDSGQSHIAFNGFNAIVSRPAQKETAGVQLAALECMNRIHSHYPTVAFAPELLQRFDDLRSHAAAERRRETLWITASALFRAELSNEKPSNGRVEKILSILAGSGPYEELARGAWQARNREYPLAIASLTAFGSRPSLPKELDRYRDHANLMLSRVHYSSGAFEKSAESLKKVRKSSNELAATLSELSWAYLQEGKYSEAIGTAMNLQAGGMRHTFAPEAPMVMAMALNEICQYPESVRAVNVFRRHYEKPYRWLSDWQKAGGKGSLYSSAVSYLRKQGTVPDRVASEWVRSPIFISHQDEINLLFDERKTAVTLGRSGSSEQKRVSAEIRKLHVELTARLKKHLAKKDRDENAPLPKEIHDQLVALKKQIVLHGRLRNAAPVWRVLLANYQQAVPRIEKLLIERINSDLVARSQRMYHQLEEIAENNQLIEVEIYNGASQDIIWQNAHPEYKAMAAKFQGERASEAAAKVWDWGRAPSGLEDSGEIWEDELGSFKANLYDNCESKDKFLALKKKKSA